MRRRLPLFLFAGAVMLWQPSSGKNIYVNSQEYEVDTLTYKHYIGPGTTYARYRVPVRPMDIFVLETDISNPYIHVETWNGGDAAVGGEQPTSVYARKDAPGRRSVAAHNGDFYTTANGEAGLSRMGLYSAGECIFNATGNPLLVISGDNAPMIDYVNFSGKARRADGTETRLHTVNQLRLEWEPATFADQLSLYTPAFGTKMNAASSGGKLAYLVPEGGAVSFPANEDIVLVVDKVIDNPGLAELPENGAVLHGVGASAAFLEAMAPGEKVHLTLGTSMPNYSDVTSFREAIGGSGHIILRNGELQNINNPDLHPRTFMGISKDRKTLYSVVVDGRTGMSAGIDLDDEGRVLQWLGAWDGINLDGGGSSSVVVGGSQMNHPSDGAERAVGNGVIFYSTAPDDAEIASIAFEPRAFRVPITAKFRPAVYGYNKYGFLQSRDLDDVKLSCDPNVGVINDRGEFVASGEVCAGKIYAEYPGGLKTEQVVMTVDSKLSLDYDTYIINDRREWPLRMSAPLGRFTYDVDPSVIDWTCADTDVALYADGYVRGGMLNGTTTLTGNAANFEGTVTLLNESVAGTSHDFTDIGALMTWSVRQTGGTGTKLEAIGSTGWQVSYTGNGSSRGAGITIKPADRFRSYGIPNSLTFEINPGEAPVKEISLSYTNGHGEHGTFYMLKGATLQPGVATVVTVPLAELADPEDNTFYPLTFSQVKFDMGVSEKNKDYVVKVLRAEYGYDVPEGIVSPCAPGDGDALEVAVDGRMLEVACGDGGDLCVYDMSGRLCASARVAGGARARVALGALSAGVYVVRLNSSSAKIVLAD